MVGGVEFRCFRLDYTLPIDALRCHLKFVFQMMVKLFAALTHKAQVILLEASRDYPEDCAKGYEQPTPVLPGVEEAKRGRFAYP